MPGHSHLVRFAQHVGLATPDAEVFAHSAPFNRFSDRFSESELDIAGKR